MGETGEGSYNFEMNRVKQAVADARSRGPVSPDRALKMAEQAAELDDSEGLGELRVEEWEQLPLWNQSELDQI